jgi:uncharacterized protein (DUF1778 family)
MAKIELSVSDDEKWLLQEAADLENLRLATWAKAELIGRAKAIAAAQYAIAARKEGAGE